MPEEKVESQVEEKTEPTLEEEAETAAIEAALAQLKPEEIPKDEAELAKFVREIVPGLDKAEDADVLTAWKGAAKAVPTGEATKAEEKPVYSPDGFTFHGTDGAALTELSPDIQKFLSETSIGYRALGKDQTPRSLADVVRNASRGHLNQSQAEQNARDRDLLSNQLKEANEQVESFQKQAAIWDSIMRAASAGNTDPFVQAVTQYVNALGAPDNTELATANMKIAELEQARKGDQLFREQIQPYLRTLAKDYNIPEDQLEQLDQHVLLQLDAIPPELFNADRVRHYLQNELISEIEGYGFTYGGNTTGESATASTKLSNDVTETIKALQAEVANLKNAAAAAKAKGGPPASTAGATGTGTSEPDFKTAAEGFAALRNR